MIGGPLHRPLAGGTTTASTPSAMSILASLMVHGVVLAAALGFFLQFEPAQPLAVLDVTLVEAADGDAPHAEVGPAPAATASAATEAVPVASAVAEAAPGATARPEMLSADPTVALSAPAPQPEASELAERQPAADPPTRSVPDLEAAEPGAVTPLEPVQPPVPQQMRPGELRPAPPARSRATPAAPAATASPPAGTNTPVPPGPPPEQTVAAPPQVAVASGGGTVGSAAGASGAQALSRVQPQYPPSARARGAQGRVVLLVEVGADGRPGRVDVQQSSSHADLDRAAREAVLQWRFSPAHRAGTAVPDTILVPVLFSLR